MVNVWQQTFAALMFGTEAVVSIVRALDNVTLVAICALGAIAKSGKWTANGSCRRDVNVRIAACIVDAVAAEEVCAGWHAMISDVVREVAAVTT